MIASILAILKSLLDAIPALNSLLKFFSKAPQEKVDEAVKDLRNEIDDFKKTGRPGQ